MTPQTVLAAPATVPKGGCGCDFADRSDHDRLLALETDPTVSADVIRAMTTFAEGEDWPADRVPFHEIPTFLGQHSWSDPMWSYRLRGDLRFMTDALRPLRAAGSDLPIVDVSGDVLAIAVGRLTDRVERLAGRLDDLNPEPGLVQVAELQVVSSVDGAVTVDL